MSGGLDEKVNPAVEDTGKVDYVDHHEKNAMHSELLDDDLMRNAFAAENAEHEITAWQAVKSHPMACFWAFLMCFTIVSPLHPSIGLQCSF